MILIVTEKPSVGETIADILNVKQKNFGYRENDMYIVTWCSGHLAAPAEPEKYDPNYKHRCIEDLPIIPKRWRIDVTDDGRKQFNIIKRLMNRKDVERIICATDAGREGECIFRFVYSLAKCNKPYMRLWSSSMDDKAIIEGIRNPKEPEQYDNLYRAGVARTKIDWLIGINGSRLLSCMYNADLRLGRVMTYVLFLIVKRHYDILNFTEQKYYTLKLLCQNEYGGFYAKSMPDVMFSDKHEAESISYECNGQKAEITNIERKEHTLNPPKLYDLTTLQRDANRVLGYTAAQTSAFTQKLYEKKLCSYPRTDSKFITAGMKDTACKLFDRINDIFHFIRNIEYEPNFLQIINDQEVSDHYAIIPDANNLSYGAICKLSEGEKNILSLLVTRFICAVSEPYQYETVKITLNCCGYDFYAAQKINTHMGWKGIEQQIKSRMISGAELSENADEELFYELPQLTEVYDNVTSSVEEHTTKPPKPYNDDTLLSAMIQAGKEYMTGDCKGIGTPATRAETIERLVQCKYVIRKGKHILPTETGIDLIKIAPKELMDAQTVAGWETALQNIEKGNSDPNKLLDQVSDYVTALVDKYASSNIDTNVSFSAQKEHIGICPRCGQYVIESKYGYSCESGEKGCGFVLWKHDKYKKINISTAQAKQLLNKGFAKLSAVNKNGQKYRGTFKIVDTGKYINLEYVPELKMY